LKAWHAIGLTLLALCILRALLASPLIPLFLAAALVVLLLSLRSPVVLAVGAFAIGQMPHSYLIAWGLPLIGINFLDLAVLLMCVVVLARWSEVRAALSTESLLRILVVFVFAAGLVALAHGQLEGFGMRTALRSFRFYFHFMITFYFAALLARPSQQKIVVSAWMILVLVQLFLVGTNVITYSPDDPGTLLLAPDIYWTSTHFLPLKTFYPALIALAILAVSGRKQPMLLTAGLWSLVAFEFTVLAFTYKRSQYVGLTSGLLAVGLGALFVEFHRSRRYTAVLFRWLGVVFLLVVGTSAAFQLALRTVPEDAEHVQENLLRRALFLNQADTDAPIQDRLEGLRAGWRDIRDNPIFGTGLGDSLTYARAQIFHSGWMWVAVSAGLPAAIMLLLVVCLAGARTLRTLATNSEAPLASALRLGFFACLAALAGNALSWGSTLDIGDVSDWGLLLGLLAVSMPRRSQKEVTAVCPAEPATAAVR
jgi:hypothetical protein